MKIVGLVSAYREGALVQGAIRSLEAVGLDELLVYEGPAGPPLEADVPESDYGEPVDTGTDHVEQERHYDRPGRKIVTGRWRTDARKRDQMLKQAQRLGLGGEPVWGIWLDGDEILVNGEYLRDRLQAIVWNDEHDGTGQPTIHWPMRVVEADGSMGVTTGRLFRVDKVQSIDISVSVVTNAHGIEEGWGNVSEDARLWIEMWMRAVETGRMIAWPPISCEPHIYHRSNLRHPLRRGLRLHAQEADELRKAGKL